MGLYNQITNIDRENIYSGYARGFWMTPICNFTCKLPNIENIANAVKDIAYAKKNESNKQIETDISSKIKKYL